MLYKSFYFYCFVVKNMSSESSPPIRIALADDHFLVREAFQSILQSHPNYQLVGVATNGIELLEIVIREQPDLVIIDMQMPVFDGTATTSKLHEEHPHISVLAMSVYHEPLTIARILAAGAHGFILKDCSIETLNEAINAVIQKELYLSPQINRNLIELIKESTYNPFGQLQPIKWTSKEVEVIKLICQEKTAKEIATQLNISLKSAENLKTSILHKIGARNAVGLAIYAVRTGII